MSKTYTFWTDAEIQMLQDVDKTLAELHSAMPYRTFRSIRSKCAKLGIKRRERGKSHRRLEWSESYLTAEKRAFLDGILLSDGCLVGPNSRNQHQAYLKLAQKHKECLDYFLSEFLEYKPVCGEERVASVMGGRKSHIRFRAHTKTHPDFTGEYTRWYPDGQKIIPADLVLTPVAVLNWYIGDGSRHKRLIRLHTEGFSASDIRNVLLTQMQKLGFEPRLDDRGAIRLTVKGSVNLLKFVDDVAVQRGAKLRCYAHKFEDI